MHALLYACSALHFQRYDSKSSALPLAHSTPLHLRQSAAMALRLILAAAFAVLARALASASVPALGINYGQVADNLPPPQAAAALLRALNATKVKLYDADARVLTAFAGSGADFTVGVPDRLVPRFAADPSAAAAWIRSNILPHIPATSITAVTVGNEVLSGEDPTMLRSLLPAMEALHAALAACNLTSRVSVTTPHSLAVLSSSFPPSSAAFRREILPYMSPLLGFLAKTGAPFLINAYPYFAYKADPTGVDLGYVLFEPSATAGVEDEATGLHYNNMLHAQVDAVRAAICKANYGKGLEIRVSETGWPSEGDDDEAGATPENAARYNGNLMRMVAEGKGTPAAPSEPLVVYVFALFNEDQKPGPASERHYGLFKPDGTPAYDVGVKSPAIRGWKGSGGGGGGGNGTSSGSGGAGLVVAQGPGGADGVGPGTGYYTVSAAAGNKARRRCVESLVVAAGTALAIASGLRWS